MERLTRPKYSFTSGALPAGTFTVVAFTGQEGVSQLYQFDLTLMADPGLDPQQVLNHAARFTIHRDGGDRVYHGVLCSLELFQAVGGGECYRARLVPRLWWLGLTRYQQVFLDQTVPSFLEAVLLDGGLTTLDFEFRLKASYQPEPFVCQYQESHWEFLSRWLEREGICFFFEQLQDFEKVVFTDHRAAHADLDRGRALDYLPVSGLESDRETVQSFACQSRIVPGQVLLKDHNYERPSLELEGRAQVDPQGRGQVYLYGEHFSDTGEGARLAELRREELLCRRDQYRGASTAACLAPGFLMPLARHFRPAFNRKYLVLEVRHQGSQAGALDAGVREAMPGAAMEVLYRNEFLAIPDDVQFRPPLQTARPRIAGGLSGWIDGAGDGIHAELDDQGRYKVILPFDRSGRKGGKASAFLRMAQPYAGAEEGMHFPLRKGTEVLLTFIHGDPDRPVIAGALPNSAAHSPVSGHNQTTNRLVSPAGNELQMEDGPGAEGILLHVPSMDTFVQLGTQTGPRGGEAPPTTLRSGIRMETPHPFWIAHDLGKAGAAPQGSLLFYGKLTEDHLRGTSQAAPSTVQDLAQLQVHAHAQDAVSWLSGFGPDYRYQEGPTYAYLKGPSYVVFASRTGAQDEQDGGAGKMATAHLEYAGDLLDPNGPGGFKAGRFRGTWSSIKGNELGAMTPNDTSVTKNYGNFYNLTKGNTITVHKGGQQNIRYGGKLLDQAYTRDGFKYFESQAEAGIVTTRTWDLVSKIQDSLTYSDKNTEFSSQSNFSVVPSVKVVTYTTPVVHTAVNVSAGGKVALDFTASLDFKVVGGVGLEMKVKTKLASLSYNNTSGSFAWEGPGTKAAKDAALKAEILTMLVKACQTEMSVQNLSISQRSADIYAGELKIDGSIFKFL